MENLEAFGRFFEVHSHVQPGSTKVGSWLGWCGPFGWTLNFSPPKMQQLWWCFQVPQAAPILSFGWASGSLYRAIHQWLIRATSTGWFVTKRVGKLVSHRIHVWYIYLHQWLIYYNKCRQIYYSSSHGSGKMGLFVKKHGKKWADPIPSFSQMAKARTTIQGKIARS